MMREGAAGGEEDEDGEVKWEKGAMGKGRGTGASIRRWKWRRHTPFFLILTISRGRLTTTFESLVLGGARERDWQFEMRDLFRTLGCENKRSFGEISRSGWMGTDTLCERRTFWDHLFYVRRKQVLFCCAHFTAAFPQFIAASMQRSTDWPQCGTGAGQRPACSRACTPPGLARLTTKPPWSNPPRWLSPFDQAWPDIHLGMQRAHHSAS